jgi:adenylate cyclase
MPSLAVAIGLSSGPACVGNIGSRQRYSYSAIGDTVNVTARIEASCRHIGYDVVISKETCDGAGDMATLPAGRIRLKGKLERAALHILVGDKMVARSPSFRRLQSLHEGLLKQVLEQGRIVPEDLEACKAVARDVEVGLVEFYDRLPHRLSDY